MTIPFLDLTRLHNSIRTELEQAFETAIDQSSFIGGDPVERFESEFAAAHGAPRAVGCGSGTDAISLALHALGVGAGDEVVVPSMTFFASAEAVLHIGATPVLADVDPQSLLLAPSAVEEVRTERTRAVLPVHLFGHTVPFDHLEHWRAEGLLVVEDAAQAHLASWQGRMVGTVGDAATFSFFPGKNLGALGDAGAVLVHDDAVAGRIKRQRDHGRTDKYVHSEVGVSSRLDALQAALLSVKLQHLAEWTEARRTLADHYRSLLTEVATAQVVPWEEGAVHHLMVVRVAERASVIEALRESGIATGIHYPVALSQQPALAERPADCPASEEAADEVLSLPLDPLMTLDEVERVVDALAHAAAT